MSIEKALKRRIFKALLLRGQDLNLRPLGYEPNELPAAPPREINLILLIKT